VYDGEVVTLTATADISSTFTGWSGAGCSGTGDCVVTMTETRTITAAFALNYQELSVTLAGTGSGGVSSIPSGINCPDDCTETLDLNTVITLTATADSDSTFTGWSGGGCSSTGTCVVNMTEAVSVTATFTRKYLINLPLIMR